jgi:hypothetical protein
MTRTKLVIFSIAVLLSFTVVATLNIIPIAEAVKSQGTYMLKVRSSEVCGDRLCSEQPAAEKPKEMPKEQKMTEEKKMAEKEMTMKMDEMHQKKMKTGAMMSSQDPGIGHETHQLAVLLPPSDKVYSGILTYAASEPIQLVTLTGPLKAGEDKGQPIWTPDGKTKFGLTFVDKGQSAGSWKFTGNALAVHTMNTTPFPVSYTISYSESPMSDTVKSGTAQSMQDPGVGHEGHQLAIILPPRDSPYKGIVSFSASEPVQLVALHGPLKAGEDIGQPTWTPDGKTKFGLTFVDKGESSGVWEFTGNALAVHTMKTTPFTVTYTVSAQ